MLTHVIRSEDIANSTYSNVKDILEIAMPNVQMVASNHSDDRVKIQGLDNKYLTFFQELLFENRNFWYVALHQKRNKTTAITVSVVIYVSQGTAVLA